PRSFPSFPTRRSSDLHCRACEEVGVPVIAGCYLLAAALNLISRQCGKARPAEAAVAQRHAVVKKCYSSGRGACSWNIDCHGSRQDRKSTRLNSSHLVI